MPLDVALIELNKYALDFASIGDAEHYIKYNKDEFLNKWTRVIQNYNYILNNYSYDEKYLVLAIDIIDDIVNYNPSLEKYLSNTLQSDKVINIQKKYKLNIDANSLIENIQKIISSMQNIQTWNQQQIIATKWELKKCQKKLFLSTDCMDNNKYESYKSLIFAHLDLLDYYYYYINEIHQHNM